MSLIKEWGIDNEWTLFLDRDGVINHETFENYISHPKDFIFLEGVLEALKQLSEIFPRIIIVTNQQGVGKGLMTEEDLISVNHFMLEEIVKYGGRIDAVYYATELRGTPNGLRKPSRKMADLAKIDYPEIAFEKSIMVGNSLSDMEFGTNLRMKVVFIGDVAGRELLSFNSLQQFLEEL